MIASFLRQPSLPQLPGVPCKLLARSLLRDFEAALACVCMNSSNAFFMELEVKHVCDVDPIPPVASP